MSPLHLFLSIILLMAALDPIQAVQYHAIDNAPGTPGGTRFENEIGIPYSQQTLQLASEFIWQTFKQGEGDRKNYEEVTMMVESFNFAPAYTGGNFIHLSDQYIGNYSGDVRIEIIGILYHETTHIWQWFANFECPIGLIEGIADYVRLKAGWAPLHWPKRGTGTRWDEGYAITAYFLEYCNGIKDGFVADLNASMKDSYSDDLFVRLLGKTVDELWNDYKSHYGT